MNYIHYNIIFLVSLFLSFLSEKIIKQNKKYVLYVLLWGVVAFVSIRFDVGPDYYNYVQAFKTAIHYNLGFSIDYQFFGFLSKLFSFSDKGYIGVFFLYFLITFFLILRTLKKYDIVFFGILIFFGLGYFLDSMDRIRQYAAIAMFLYSVNDIIVNDFKRFFVKILIASFLHVSAFALIPFYFIAKIKINRFTTVFVYFILLIGYFTHIFEKLIYYIISLVPGYGEIYLNTQYLDSINNLNSGLGLLTKSLFIFIVAFFAPINPRYRTILMIGLSIMMFASGNLLLDRFSDYFTIIIIIAFPLMIKQIKIQYNRIFIVLPLIMYLVLLFEFDIGKNNFDYQTIFSENYEKEIFINHE